MKNIFYQKSIVTLSALLFSGFFVGIIIGHQRASNKSELLDAMSPISREQLVADTVRLNKLIDDLKRNESNVKNISVSSRQEISNLYLSLADILANDLRNVQIRSPKMAATARVTINGLQGLSNDIMKQEVYPPFFQPQNIH